MTLRPADEPARGTCWRLVLPLEPMLSRNVGIRGSTALVDAARFLPVSAGKSWWSSMGAKCCAAAAFAFFTSDCKALIFIQVRKRGPMGPRLNSCMKMKSCGRHLVEPHHQSLVLEKRHNASFQRHASCKYSATRAGDHVFTSSSVCLILILVVRLFAVDVG